MLGPAASLYLGGIRTGDSVITLLLSGPFVPFTVSLGVLSGLLALELLALLAGGSLFGTGAEVPDGAGSLHASFDLAPGAEPGVPALVAASEALDAAGVPEADAGGALSLLGLGRVPFAIWLAAVLFGFGVGGFAVQAVAGVALGGPLPAWAAVLPAALAGLGSARGTAGVVGGLVQQNETTATGAQFMGGMRGVVVQGIAARDRPAEVRLRDRHGNMHFMRCEPYRDSDVIAEGTEVLLLRERRPGGGWQLKILPLHGD